MVDDVVFVVFEVGGVYLDGIVLVEYVVLFV